MIKLAVLIVLIIGVGNAQDYDGDDYEVCVGLADGEMVGVGASVSCTEYFFCDQEIGLKSDCGDGFAFDYTKNECGYDDEVECIAGGGEEPEPDPEYPEPDYPEPDYPDPETTRATRAPVIPDTTVAQTTPSDPSVPDIECPTNRPGEIIFFPSSNCSEYFICANGFRMKMMCMEGFTWNQEEKQCDYPIFSRCSQNIRDDGTNVNCMRSGFYSTAYPRDCTKFVFCSAGIPMVQNCPVGYAWQNDRCVERRFASCPDLRRFL